MTVNLLHGRPLPIYGDGCNMRDWLHVRDHCRGIELILQKGAPGEVYNIGGGSECRNIDLAQLLCEVADKEFQQRPQLALTYPDCPGARGERTSSLITFVRDRPGHDRRYAIDCSKIARELGYRARVSLESGLRDTFGWYAQNGWWWKSVIDGNHDQWSARETTPNAMRIPAG